MNSPQPFAGFLIPGLVLFFIRYSRKSYISAGFCFLSFLLSRARAAWLCWAIGVAFFFVSSRSRIQIKIISSITIIAIFIIPLINKEPFSEVIMSRLLSLTNASEDHSFNSRLEAYRVLFGSAISTIVGNGMGAELNLPIGDRDSGLLALLLILGAFSTLIYFSGMGIIFIRIFTSKITRQEAFIGASASIALSGLCQIGFNLAFSGVLGIILWSFLGIGSAGIRFNSSLTGSTCSKGSAD